MCKRPIRPISLVFGLHGRVPLLAKRPLWPPPLRRRWRRSIAVHFTFGRSTGKGMICQIKHVWRHRNQHSIDRVAGFRRYNRKLWME